MASGYRSRDTGPPIYENADQVRYQPSASGSGPIYAQPSIQNRPGQGQVQGQSRTQGYSNHQGQGQGQSRAQGYSNNQGQGYERVQYQGQGRSESYSQGQGDARGQVKSQGQPHDQGQGYDKGRGHDRGDSREYGRSESIPIYARPYVGYADDVSTRDVNVRQSEDDVIRPGRVGGVRAQWERRSSGSNDVPGSRRSTARLEEDEQEGLVPRRGSVNKVSKEWRVHEDGALAHRLQEEENSTHYGHNRSERHQVREDIINAKILQHEEELRQQEEMIREIEAKRELENRDAMYIRRMMSEEEDEEDRLKRMADEDEKLARELSRMVQLEETSELQQQQERDERVAIELQKREERRYERYKEKKRERELERTKRRLEKEIEEQRRQVLPSGDSVESTEQEGTRGKKRLSSEGVVEDMDFTDFYRVDPELDDVSAREEQERQDAELARLLQDQEHKRGGKPNRDQLKSIEERDAELAKVIQEQEKIRAERREKRMRERGQIRSLPSPEQAASLSADPGLTTPSTSADNPGASLSIGTTSTSARFPLPHYPSPPNYEEAISRSRENLDQSGSRENLDQSTSRLGSRDSVGQSPLNYRTPIASRDSHSQSHSQDNLNRSRDYSNKSPSTYYQSQTQDYRRHNDILNRSFERSQDDMGAMSYTTRDHMKDHVISTNQSYLVEHNRPIRTSQSMYSTQTHSDQSAMRNSRSMQNDSSRNLPNREELRRAVDPHADSDSEDDAGFQGQGRVQGHPNSRASPRSTQAPPFNIVTTLDPTYRPTANHGASNSSAANHGASNSSAANHGASNSSATNHGAYAPGQDCHEYLRSQFSTLEYGDPTLDSYVSDDGDDWMPVQGQRRQAAGKSAKKRPVSAHAGDKEKCKQQ